VHDVGRDAAKPLHERLKVGDVTLHQASNLGGYWVAGIGVGKRSLNLRLGEVRLRNSACGSTNTDIIFPFYYRLLEFANERKEQQRKQGSRLCCYLSFERRKRYVVLGFCFSARAASTCQWTICR